MASNSRVSTPEEKELEVKLIDAGNKLLQGPPSSVDELLNLLEKVDKLLSGVGQDHSTSMQDALVPTMKALITDEIFRHSNMDVKVSVASCITELTRITAPVLPYSDKIMKEFFQLIVSAFETLSRVSEDSNRCYLKALSILETVAKIRLCVMLLDLQGDSLITEIFQLFLRIIELNYSDAAFGDMEEIMNWVIEESDEISLELLSVLLASVKKENQNISPLSWKLGEKVLRNCAARVQPYLTEAVKSMNLDIQDYAEVVASLCQDAHIKENTAMKEVAPEAVHLVVIGLSAGQNTKSRRKGRRAVVINDNDNFLEDGNCVKTLERCDNNEQLRITDGVSDLESVKLDVAEMQTETDAVKAPRRRGRKPKHLIKVENRHGTTRNNQNTGEDCSKGNVSFCENSAPQEVATQLESGMTASTSKNHNTKGGSRVRGRPKKKRSTIDEDDSPDLLSDFRKRLQGRVKGQILQYSDVAVENGSDDTEKVKAKAYRATKKSKDSAKDNVIANNITGKKRSVILSNVKGEKKSSVHRMKQSKDKSSSKKQDTEDSGEKKSSVQKMKHTKAKTSSEKQDTEESGDLITTTPSATELRNKNLSGKLSKTKRQRKHTLREEETPKRPRVTKSYGEELVGSKIKVWWPLDHAFYEGVISSFDPLKKRHKVLYADGDEEILNLNRERWALLTDASCDEVSTQEQEAHLTGPDVVYVKTESEVPEHGDKPIDCSALESPRVKDRSDIKTLETRNSLLEEDPAGKLENVTPLAGSKVENSRIDITSDTGNAPM